MRRLTTICLASTALIALPALGQAQSQTQTPGAQLQGQQSGQSTEQPRQQQTQQQQDQQTREFLRRAAQGNMFGLESSRIAVDQATRQDVQSFARRMINDHEQLEEELRQAAGGFDLPQQLSQQQEDDLAQLEDLDGERFDRRYVSYLVRGHVDLVNLFQDYAQDGSNQQLRSFAEETHPRLNEHLNMAMDLQRQIVGGPQARAPQGDRRQAQTQDRRMQEPQRGQQRAGQDWQRQRTGQQMDQERRRFSDRESARQRQDQQGRTAGVQVTQQPPQVTVRQQQPQIIVRQSPPRIVVDQRQPEIIVRMPEPQVDVATERPEVDVRMPQPQVEVMRAQQEQVRVQSAERPQVRYERTGEPEVEYREAEGQPRIRYEQMAQQQQGQQDRQQFEQQSRQQARQQTGQQTRQQTWDEERMTGAIPRQQDAQQQAGQQQQRGLRARLSLDELQGMEVANVRGDDLGEVNDVIIDGSNRVFLVVGYGGFLGVGEREVVLPLNRFEFSGDQLVIRGMTDDQLRQQPQYREQQGFRRADPNEEVTIRQRQQAAGTRQAQ